MTPQQHTDLLGFIATGCPVETAIDGSGLTSDEFDQAFQDNAELERQMRRGGALAEVQQLQNVKQAGRETKHWRASVWWLERCRGHRYTAKSPDTITMQQFDSFCDDLARIIDSEVRDTADHDRVVARLSGLIGQYLPMK